MSTAEEIDLSPVIAALRPLTWVRPAKHSSLWRAETPDGYYTVGLDTKRGAKVWYVRYFGNDGAKRYAAPFASETKAQELGHEWEWDRLQRRNPAGLGKPVERNPAVNKRSFDVV